MCFKIFKKPRASQNSRDDESMSDANRFRYKFHSYRDVRGANVR